MSTVHIDRLLETAVRTGATDLCASSGESAALVIDGRLRRLETKPLTATDVLALIRAILPKEHQGELEQTGRVLFSFSFGEKARFRCAACAHSRGHALLLRMQPTKPRTFEELGLPPIIRRLCHRPCGLFLMAGRGGSGRTGIVATCVDYINRNKDVRIVTLERPIEYVHSSQRGLVIQREVGVHVPTFVAGIEQARRDGADVLVVGELEDDETIRAAVQAAGQRCLVFGTMYARSAARAVARLTAAHGGTEPTEHAHAVSTNLLAALVGELCSRLGAGGLVPAYEFLVNTPAVSELIYAGRLDQLDLAIQTGKQYGMQLLDEHLFALYEGGTIAAEEAVEHARRPAEMQRRVEQTGRGSGEPDTPAEPDDGGDPSPSPARPKPPPPGLSAESEGES